MKLDLKALSGSAPNKVIGTICYGSILVLSFVGPATASQWPVLGWLVGVVQLALLVASILAFES